MDAKIVDFINHYQRSIEKHIEDPDSSRILHCLNKLASLTVNVQILQSTGVGRTVNTVRKYDGEVGDVARKLVLKWKSIVADAEKPASPQEFKRPSVKAESSDDSMKRTHEEPPKHKSSDSKDKSKHHQHASHHQSSSHHHSNSSHKEASKEEHKSRSSEKHHKSSHISSHHQTSASSHTEKSLKRKHDGNDPSIESKENHRSIDSTSRKHPKLDPEMDLSSQKSNSSKHSGGHSSSQNKNEEKRSSSSSKSVSPKKEQKPSKSKKKTEECIDEIDSEQMGFAEALAMFDKPGKKKTTKKDLADKLIKVPSNSSSRNDKKSSSTSSSAAGPSKDTRKSIQALTAPPKVLMQKPKLEPLPDIAKEIVVPEYRPMPLSSAVQDYINESIGGQSLMCGRPPPKFMSDKDLLAESFSSKANRTRVYSGNRSARSQIPMLFEMCIRVLQENIDYLESTGGVPFDILKPVLERAKPEQLNVIEYYNPYLLEDSDVLWEPHCKRKFRIRQRMEMETWREMYERCTREDEEKLSRLTQNIKQHHETASNGIQKTKMAFMDMMVKPPRNVKRMQEQFGTDRKLVSSPLSRVPALRNMAPNITNGRSGDARLRVAASIRDDAQVVVGRGFRGGGSGVKKAPMMAKILSKFKR